MLAGMGVTSVDGILLDLGVSSHQLDTPGRGFSFQREGPLDMRMGSSGMTAADLVNTASPEELARIFREYGDEPRAIQFAVRIVRARERALATTLELADLIAAGRTGPRHPATRVFQRSASPSTTRSARWSAPCRPLSPCWRRAGVWP